MRASKKSSEIVQRLEFAEAAVMLELRESDEKVTLFLFRSGETKPLANWDVTSKSELRDSIRLDSYRIGVTYHKGMIEIGLLESGPIAALKRLVGKTADVYIRHDRLLSQGSAGITISQSPFSFETLTPSNTDSPRKHAA